MLKKTNLAFLSAAMLFTAASVGVLAQRGGGGRAGGGTPTGDGVPSGIVGNAQAVAEGEKIYNQTCTACHGRAGAGGELGPPIATPNRRYLRRTDPEVFDAIKNGISGTQMPPFGSRMSDDDIWKIAAYIHGLRGTAIDAPAQGNAANGDAIFWGKGQCGSCHMIKAKGSILGPDLTNLAGQRKVVSIVDALTKDQHRIPGDGGTHDSTLLPLQTYQPVRITMTDGKVLNGILKNEDSFSLQVLSRDEKLHLLKRSAVKEVYYEPKSLMPTDYDKRLAPAEFQDLMAFLTRLYVPPPPAPSGRGGGGGGGL
jgi:cytochrome c oxidase cbb3-type subunit III